MSDWRIENGRLIVETSIPVEAILMAGIVALPKVRITIGEDGSVTADTKEPAEGDATSSP